MIIEYNHKRYVTHKRKDMQGGEILLLHTEPLRVATVESVNGKTVTDANGNTYTQDIYDILIRLIECPTCCGGGFAGYGSGYGDVCDTCGGLGELPEQ